MPTCCISLVSLYLYTQKPDFDKQLHLVFLVEDFPDFLLNETNCLLKAESIQQQYVLTDTIRMLNTNFGRESIEIMRLEEREKLIEEKVENIMALDIALLKFIESVPERIEQNSFKLPQNADVPYLVGEYMSIKEKQIVSKISKAMDLYNTAEFNENFIPLPKFQHVLFNNLSYTSRVVENHVIESAGNDIQLQHEYRLLVNFADEFFKSSKIREMIELEESAFNWDKMNTGIELRQTLFALASMFSESKETHDYINRFFGHKDNDIDREEKVNAKHANLSSMSLRSCYLYSTKFMILTLYFMFLEENAEKNQSKCEIKNNIEEFRNQLILILTRMIEHLIEYIQFKAASNKYKVYYSQLPLIDIENLDAKKRPITSLMYIMQYALNFAPFLCNSI
ncbi:hypothetical protein [Drosophila suzukii associated hytrosavirus 1]|nr:hypothetical protein [Drosophila suzukii associated hytrosavirus 1]